MAGFWPARFSGTQDTGPNYEERLLDLSCCEKVHEASVFFELPCRSHLGMNLP